MNKGWILDVNVKRLGRTEETRKGSEKELPMRLEQKYENDILEMKEKMLIKEKVKPIV